MPRKACRAKAAYLFCGLDMKQLGAPARLVFVGNTAFKHLAAEGTGVGHV